MRNSSPSPNGPLKRSFHARISRNRSRPGGRIITGHEGRRNREDPAGLPPAVHLLKALVQISSGRFDESFRHPIAYLENVILESFHHRGHKFRGREIHLEIAPLGSALRV